MKKKTEEEHGVEHFFDIKKNSKSLLEANLHIKGESATKATPQQLNIETKKETIINVNDRSSSKSVKLKNLFNRRRSRQNSVEKVLPVA